MKVLTRAEEDVMQVLWKLKSAFVKDIISKLPDPKPAYNTVSTFIRILEQKGFVGHESHGRSYKYFPLISKEDYTKTYVKGLVSRYFEGSYKQMVSFFTNEEDLTLAELERLIKELKEKK